MCSTVESHLAGTTPTLSRLGLLRTGETGPATCTLVILSWSGVQSLARFPRKSLLSALTEQLDG